MCRNFRIYFHLLCVSFILFGVSVLSMMGMCMCVGIIIIDIVYSCISMIALINI